jgi:hypothetical protein
VELALLQNLQAQPLGGLARRQTSLLQQALGVLGLPLNLLGLLDLVRLPGLVPLPLVLVALVGRQVVAGEMRVLHKQQLRLRVCNLSTRYERALIKPFSRINCNRPRNHQSPVPSVH